MIEKETQKKIDEVAMSRKSKTNVVNKILDERLDEIARKEVEK